MPTLHRLAVFRDDLVFVFLLYQRWIYPIDKKRANEFGCAPHALPVHERPAVSLLVLVLVLALRCTQRRCLTQWTLTATFASTSTTTSTLTAPSTSTPAVTFTFALTYAPTFSTHSIPAVVALVAAPRGQVARSCQYVRRRPSPCMFNPLVVHVRRGGPGYNSFHD